jgi:hypothetical protein
MSAPPAVEHRGATRYPAPDVPSIKGLRLSPHGAEAKLVNISVTGILAECTVRLKVGSAVTVLFEGGFNPISAAGRVARCEVSAMGRDGVLRYHVGIAFNAPIESKDVPPPAAAIAQTVSPPVEPPPLPSPPNVSTPTLAPALVIPPKPPPAAPASHGEMVSIDLESLTFSAPASPPPIRNRW